MDFTNWPCPNGGGKRPRGAITAVIKLKGRVVIVIKLFLPRRKRICLSPKKEKIFKLEALLVTLPLPLSNNNRIKMKICGYLLKKLFCNIINNLS